MKEDARKGWYGRASKRRGGERKEIRRDTKEREKSSWGRNKRRVREREKGRYKCRLTGKRRALQATTKADTDDW